MNSRDYTRQKFQSTKPSGWADSRLDSRLQDVEEQVRPPTLAGMAMAAVWVLGFALLLSIVFDHPLWQFH